MSLILDLVILLLFAANVYAGWRNGLIRTVLHTCSTLVSLVVSYLFSPALSEYLRATFLTESVTDRISSGLRALMEAGSETIDMATLFRDAPEAFTELHSGFGIRLEDLEAQFADAIAAGSDSLLDDVTAYIAGPITEMLSMALAFLILFAVSVTVLHLACLCLDTVCRLPILKQMNALLGLLLGILTGLLMAWGLSAVLAELMPALARLYPEAVSETVIENTFFIKLLAEIGLIPAA